MAHRTTHVSERKARRAVPATKPHVGAALGGESFAHAPDSDLAHVSVAADHVSARMETAASLRAEASGETSSVRHDGVGSSADGAGTSGDGAVSGEGVVRGVGFGGSARGPALIASPGPCRNYFPAQAHVDHGAVQVHVHVDPAGRAAVDVLLDERPRGQGFGSAARACAAQLRFAPAVDQRGIAVAGDAKLELRFDRS